MTGALIDQEVTTGTGEYDISAEFSHVDGSAALEFEATQPNGEPLPDYVKFDEASGQITNNSRANELLKGHAPRKGWEEFYSMV